MFKLLRNRQQHKYNPIDFCARTNMQDMCSYVYIFVRLGDFGHSFVVFVFYVVYITVVVSGTG